ncbi:hypothetical protein PHYBOEH_003051 [Phytophthora boehmeriae]|uniref:Uncharacterized protein n=1 Tax=Phytophthora boehmeriae TaxID=109152 RepID=A0A8T1V6P3_9STRA|nr:hypothetical protein PHYBOEH_003051 [Phytophthora boehmeriae]
MILMVEQVEIHAESQQTFGIESGCENLNDATKECAWKTGTWGLAARWTAEKLGLSIAILEGSLPTTQVEAEMIPMMEQVEIHAESQQTFGIESGCENLNDATEECAWKTGTVEPTQ